MEKVLGKSTSDASESHELYFGWYGLVSQLFFQLFYEQSKSVHTRSPCSLSPSVFKYTLD